MIKKAVHSIKKRGIRGSYKRWKNGPDKIELVKFWSFITETERYPFHVEDYQSNKNEKLTLNWVIPEIGIGSGGHINIFRFISYLERHDIHNRVYIYKSPTPRLQDDLITFIRTYFKILDTNVELYPTTDNMVYAHGIVATNWETAYFVRRFDNVISKFYFVQDFEPYFYAKGSEYEFAENTYKFGFRGLTAGEWLKDICINQYHMVADSFGFSYDKDLYQPRPKPDNKKRVFFYARPVTPRRDFELGLLALTLLKKKMPEVEVVFAGWDCSNYDIPFEYDNKGILDISQLSDVYSKCDLCLIISNTNVSLLPLEVMASGSIAVCSKGPNSDWLTNSENSVLVDYDPIAIAHTMEKYLKDEELMKKIREKGIEFAQSTSWDVEGEKVKQSILKGIKEDEKSISNRR